MKKLLLIFVLAVLANAAAFAEYSAEQSTGWGIGGGFQFGTYWRDGGTHSGLSLFLKAPGLPIYWGISASVFNWEFGDRTRFGFLVTGDYMLRHMSLVPEADLSWFLAAGGYIGIRHDSDRDISTLFDLGVRVPVGLSWVPVDFLEVFLALAPALGFYLGTGDDNRGGIGMGLQGDFGVRFWL